MDGDLIAKKLKIKPGSRITLMNAPADYPAALGALPPDVEISLPLGGKFDWILLFAQDQEQLAQSIPMIAGRLRPAGLLWIAFPKGTSKIQTDLTRDQGWESVTQADLKWINLVSLDETWSAFSLRPFKLGEKHESPMRR